MGPQYGSQIIEAPVLGALTLEHALIPALVLFVKESSLSCMMPACCENSAIWD